MYRRSALWVPVLGAALALALSSARVHAADIGKHVPADTQFLVSVNVRQILDSALGKKYLLPQLKAGLAKDANVQNALSATNFDPLSDLNRIVIAVPAVKDLKDAKDVHVTAIVHGKFDLDRIHQAADNYAQQEPNRLKIEKHGGTPVYEAKDPNQDKPGFGAFLDKETLVFSNSKDAVVAALDQKSSGKQATLDKDLEALVSKIPAGQSFWMAGAISEDVRKQLVQAGAKNPQAGQYEDVLKSLTGLTAMVKLTDGIAAKVRIHTNKGAAADKIKQTLVQGKGLVPILVGQLEQLAKLSSTITDAVEAIKITKDGNTVQIAVEFSAEDIDKAAKAAQEQSK
jgi:hypothetical protein